MSPDPSGLAYADITNPQSFNLYAYVRNNPLNSIDPSGMECVWDDGSYDAADDPDTGAADANGNHSNCTGQGGTWINPENFENSLLTNGQMSNIQYGSWSGQANPTMVSSWLTPSATFTGTVDNSVSLQIPMAAWNWAAGQTLPPHGFWTYGNWAGSGGRGAPIDNADAGAMMHDYCYHMAGDLSANANYGGHSAAAQACNQSLCDTESAVQANLITKARATGADNLYEGLSPSDFAQYMAADDMINYFSIVPFGNSCRVRQ